MADLDVYAEGRAARRRGAPRGPYTPGPRMARWQAGWDDEDALLQKALLRPCDIPRAAPREVARTLGWCAGAAGDSRSANHYVSPENRRAWDDGWSSSMPPTEEAALLRPCDIPRTAPPAATATALDPARPKPKVVQIAALAEGASSWPSLIALRDDGTLWVATVARKDQGANMVWGQLPLPPDDEAVHGR
ncbi:MAG: hypothetical protein IT429_14475 [Gemmataceae bacterium]|nr:hypothetical protein [Gemmataceae bacterium]